MKNLKLYTKVAMAFICCDILLVVSLILGYSSVKRVGTIVSSRIADAVGAGQSSEQIIQSAQQAANSQLKSFAIFTVILFVLFITISSLSTTWILRTVRRSVEMLSAATKEIAEGKTDVVLKKITDDEFGKLMDEYQEVVDTIRYQADIAEKVAEGDLCLNVVPRSEHDVLTNSLRDLVERNRNALTSIDEAAYQVMSSSSQVASASEALAQGSTEQASAIEEITASIDDIAEKTKQNATQAGTAAELVSRAIADVSEGNEQMHHMMVAMKDINEASESISKIIKVIDDIAFQTNILALNAAVEAARAGDAGKGFAVVAEEVRNLAAKSSAAAAETAELIEDSMSKVAVGSKIADDTAKALAEITKAVQESEMLINNIAEASNYQATAVSQIDQAIGQVSQVVQTNSATSEECAAASEELSNQALRMRELLSVYHLGESKNTFASAGVKASKKSYSVNHDNEKIISLGEGFGKY